MIPKALLPDRYLPLPMTSLFYVVLSFLSLNVPLSIYAFQTRTPGRFSPSTVPLALKSPYFNCWVGSTPVVSHWPTTTLNPQNLGWAGYIRVDNVTWVWLGGIGGVSNLNLSIPIDLQVTPTRTIYNFQAGPMDIRVTFLSPIEPADPVKQSLPFIYIYLEANSTDSQSHTVQVYSDISAEWVSGDRTNMIVWGTHSTQHSTYHQAQLRQPQPLSETNSQADDVTLYYAMPSNSDLKSRIGNYEDCRKQFVSQGSLSGASLSQPDTINNPFKVFSHSLDLGMISSTSHPIVWSLGVVRNQVAEFRSNTLIPYFMTETGNTSDAIVDKFVGDFQQASERANDFDTKIQNDSSLILSQYTDLVSLAARQTIGGTDLTIANNSDGKLDTSNVRMLMKDVGMSGRVNPVEVIYSAFPFFLYMNATYGGYLLSPLLEYQDVPNFSLPYAAQDLGPQYPRVTGNSTLQHDQQVEQTGNMLIMTLAHAQTSGDGSLISRHLLKRWANFLSSNLSTTQINGTLTGNTNLIMKGIIGIAAMAKISDALDQSTDAQHFANQSAVLSEQWQSSALSADKSHILANFGDDEGSWSIMYNLYADKLLKTNVVSDNINQLLTNSLQPGGTVATTSVHPFGIPLDSTTTQVTNAAWMLFTAAIVNDISVRDSLINLVWDHANSSSDAFFPPSYGLDLDGATSLGPSGPAMGGMYSILALTIPHKTIVVPSLQAIRVQRNNMVGPALGGSLGGVVVVAVAMLGGCMWRRRRNHPLDSDDMREVDMTEPFIMPYEYDPYRDQQSRDSDLRPLVSLAVPQSDGVVPSSKARAEALLLVQRSLPIDVSSRSRDPVVPSTPSSTHRESPIMMQTTSPSDSQVSPSQVEELRAEMENLTRVVREMQVGLMEAPPNYSDIQSQPPSSISQPNVLTDQNHAQP